MKKILLALLPIPGLIPVFYIQGLAYYEGSLLASGISPGLYPLGFEQILIRAYSFYVSDFRNIFVCGLLLALLLPLLSLALEKLSSRPRATSVFALVAKPFEVMGSFFEKHVYAALPGFVILIYAYIALLGALLVVWPYKHAQDRAEIRIQKNLEALLDNSDAPCSVPVGGVAMTFADEAKDRVCGFIIASSPNLVSILLVNGVHTFSLGAIGSIESSVSKAGGES